MKKFMLMLITVMACFMCWTTVLAETEGDYEFKITANGAVITSASNSLSGEVIIPDTLGGYAVYEINEEAFSYNMDITSVVIPDCVKIIDAYAFFHCENLEDVKIGENVSRIGGYAFSSTAIKSLYIPDAVEYVGVWAFSGSGLTNVRIGKGASNIEEGAFNYSNSLLSITVDEQNQYYSSLGGVLFSKDKTVLVSFPGGKSGVYTVPDGVTTIDECAFEGLDGVTAVILPDSVTKIRFAAFMGSKSIEYVYLPQNVTIGDYAFSNISKLTDIFYAGSQAQWASISKSQAMIAKNVEINYDAQYQSNAKIVVENGKAYLEVTETEEKVTLCAFYKDGMLIDIRTNVSELEIECEFDNVKIITIDSLQTLKPCCNAEIL